MKRRITLVFVVIAMVIGILSVGSVSASITPSSSVDSVPASITLNPSGDYQYKTTFVSLASGVPGVLYQPTVDTPTSHIGIFVMHSGGDYLQFLGAKELAKRGYTVLAANNSSSKSGFTGDTDLNKILVETGTAVKYLKTKVPGVTKVVLLGHSGGGTVMSSYQNIAENGVSACNGAEKIVPCPDTLKGLTPADGVMLLDSNFGLPGMLLFSMDPAITSEQNAQVLNPALDMFNPENGFNPNGSTYSDEFIQKFLTKEGQRNNQIIDDALARLKMINAGKGQFSDDEPLIIPGSNFKSANNRLFSQDVRLLAHTRQPQQLLHADGSITTEIVNTVRVPQNKTNPSPSLWDGALTTTVKRFLSTFAVRTTSDYSYDGSSINGVDWDSNYASPISAAKGIKTPTLVMGMTAHWEFMSAEYIYENSAAADKTLIYVEGADHMYANCKACGFNDDTVTPMFNYIDNWLQPRFQ
jgi:hypothetical protein